MLGTTPACPWYRDGANGWKTVESDQDSKLKFALLNLPWAVVRFFGRIVRRFFVAVGVLVALAVLGYVELESIIETSTRTTPADRRLPGHRRDAPSRGCTTPPTSPSNRRSSPRISDGCLHFLARAPHPDRRRRGHPAALRQRDSRLRRQEFLHPRGRRQGRDRARAGQACRSRRAAPGASTLTMQIAKHLRGGTGRASTEIEKIGDIVMALRIEREFTRRGSAAELREHAVLRPRVSTASKRPAGPISASPRTSSRFHRSRSSWR